MNNVFKPIKYLRGPLIVVSRVYHLYIHEIYIKRGDMVIQTELFEDKDTQILLRCKESFKMK